MKAFSLPVVILAVLLLAQGCTYFRPHQAKIVAQLDERARELTSAAEIASQKAMQHLAETETLLHEAEFITNPAGEPAVTFRTNTFNSVTNEVRQAAEALGVTGNMLRRDVNVQGKPLQDQTSVVAALLSEHKEQREAAERKEARREAEETKLRGKSEALEKKLVEYGTKFEEQRNEKITTWFKWSLIGLLAVGIPIALLVLFPPFGAFLVSTFPALSHIFNMPVSLVHNLVRGVGNTRAELQAKIATDAANKDRLPDFQPALHTTQEVLALLDQHLSTELAPGDKKIIDHLRNTLNV